MKKTHELFEGIFIKFLDMFSYILSGRTPEKIAEFQIIPTTPKEPNREKSATQLSNSYKLDNQKDINTTITPASKRHEADSLYSAHFLKEANGHLEEPKDGSSEKFPLVVRKNVYSPRKKRPRYSNLQRKKLLLPANSQLNPDIVCSYLSEARISDLLNISGFTPDLVARIYDARRHKKFSSVKEIEERVEGFMGSHLTELFSVINR